MNNKKTYLTLCYTEDYLPMVITLYYTYLHTKSKYPFLALITDNIPKEELKIFDEEKIPYKVIPYKEFKNNSLENWNGTINKLQYLTLTEYEYIMFLDADIFILENLDDIFDKYCEYNLDFIGYRYQPNPDKKYTYLCGGTFIAKPGVFSFQNILNNFINKNNDEEIFTLLFNNVNIFLHQEDLINILYHDTQFKLFKIFKENFNLNFFKYSNNLNNFIFFWKKYKKFLYLKRNLELNIYNNYLDEKFE